MPLPKSCFAFSRSGSSTAAVWAAVCVGAALGPAAAAGAASVAEAPVLVDRSDDSFVALMQSSLEVSRARASLGIDGVLKPARSTPYRQRLVNVGDAQYVAYMNVGGQVVAGLPDTTCSDVLVFSGSCRTCGGMVAYVPSQNYAEGTLQMQHRHSRGSSYSHKVQDEMQLGKFAPSVLPFWMVTRTEPDVFAKVAFESIIGLGPSERAEAEAWRNLRETVDGVSGVLHAGRIPPEPLLQTATTKLSVAKQVDDMRTPLDVLGVRTFSLCFGRAPRSDGFLVWGDDRYETSPDRFMRIPVLGRNTWTVNVTDARMQSGGSTAKLGCARGCVGTIASGLPLLEVPPSMLTAITPAITAFAPHSGNCSARIAALPDLVFEVGGVSVSLPPATYLDGSSCELTLTASGDESSFTLGTPFMREYYATFHFGTYHADRAIFVARASEGCEPMSGSASATPGE